MSNFSSFVKSNSPTIFTVGTCVGTLLTGFFAVKNTLDAQDDIEAYKNGDCDFLNVAKHYIPTCICALGSIGCAIGSNIASTKQTDNAIATALSAASLLTMAKSKNDPEYERIEEIVTDDFMNPPSKLTKGEKADDFVWVFEDFRNNQIDSWAGWFKVKRLDLERAMYDTNRKFALAGGADVVDFYKYIANEAKISGYRMDDSFATYFLNNDDGYSWSADFAIDDGYQWIDFHEKEIRDEKGDLKYIILSYPFEPRIDYSLMEYPKEDDIQREVAII